MGLFRRRDKERLGTRPNLSPLDLETLSQLRKHGVDLALPRHVLHYSYFAGPSAAREAAAEADARGWVTEVREPLPDFPEQWAVVAERPDVVLTDDVVRESTDFFNALAARHGGEYDGWEACAQD